MYIIKLRRSVGFPDRFSIIGCVGCIAGIVAIALVPAGLKIDGKTVNELIESKEGLTKGACYTAMACGAILCAGEIALSKIAEKYFVHELAAGTPFTFEGAKELMSLGIYTICISAGTSVICGIAYAVIDALSDGAGDFDLGDHVSFGLGICFIVISLFFRSAAEQLEEKNTPETSSEVK